MADSWLIGFDELVIGRARFATARRVSVSHVEIVLTKSVSVATSSLASRCRGDGARKPITVRSAHTAGANFKTIALEHPEAVPEGLRAGRPGDFWNCGGVSTVQSGTRRALRRKGMPRHDRWRDWIRRVTLWPAQAHVAASTTGIRRANGKIVAQTK